MACWFGLLFFLFRLKRKEPEKRKNLQDEKVNFAKKIGAKIIIGTSDADEVFRRFWAYWWLRPGWFNNLIVLEVNDHCALQIGEYESNACDGYVSQTVILLKDSTMCLSTKKYCNGDVLRFFRRCLFPDISEASTKIYELVKTKRYTIETNGQCIILHCPPRSFPVSDYPELIEDMFWARNVLLQEQTHHKNRLGEPD